jgi:hypothetical protein
MSAQLKLGLLLCTLAIGSAIAASSWATVASVKAEPQEVIDTANIEAEIVASLEANVAKKLARLQQK